MRLHVYSNTHKVLQIRGGIYHLPSLASHKLNLCLYKHLNLMKLSYNLQLIHVLVYNVTSAIRVVAQ